MHSRLLSLLGRAINRLGHRLVRWGYALECAGWRRAYGVERKGVDRG